MKYHSIYCIPKNLTTHPVPLGTDVISKSRFDLHLFELSANVISTWTFEKMAPCHWIRLKVGWGKHYIDVFAYPISLINDHTVGAPIACYRLSTSIWFKSHGNCGCYYLYYYYYKLIGSCDQERYVLDLVGYLYFYFLFYFLFCSVLFLFSVLHYVICRITLLLITASLDVQNW